jgi:hypothetical protein
MSKPLMLSQDGDWTIITARPSPMPKRGPVIAILAPAFLCVFLIINVSAGAGLVIWLLVSSLIFAWLAFVNRKKRRGKLPPFGVKRDALRLPDGEVIPKNRIYRLGIRNTENGGVYFYGGNSLQRAAAVGAASTQQRMMETSFAVVAQHDGTLSYLAGGLTHELASAVLDEIVTYMDGFSVSLS